jgi:poly(A) polymerase
LNVIPRDRHCISRKDISDSALKVMSRLRNQGHEAYLVGGAVRDLLLGMHPKDFDIATDATPEAVHQLFRNSRIIGRRFRIVHVRFGREIIEVTTFRGHHDKPDPEQASPTGNVSRTSSSGRLLRDNVYGTLEEDAVRRDLTVNALYYDSGSFAVYDQVNGMQDLDRRLVSIIGDPETRYREDPVRMLRVLRFAAKLDFRIAPETAAAIGPCAHLLGDIPPARLFDEFLKLFMTGYAAAAMAQLHQHDLLRYLFPDSDAALRTDAASMQLIEAALRNTDERIRDEKPVTPAFLLAVLLWPAVRERFDQLTRRGDPPIPAMHGAGQEVIASAVQHLSIPRRFSIPMREIWELQPRLQRSPARKPMDLAAKRRFRAAYDVLLLREQAGEETDGMGQWWTEFQRDLPPITREPEESPGKRGQRRGRRRRKAAVSPQD